MFRDSKVLAQITACRGAVVVARNVKKQGLKDFEFAGKPNLSDSEWADLLKAHKMPKQDVLDALKALLLNNAEDFMISVDSAQIRLNMKKIWSVLGLGVVDFPGLPRVNDPLAPTVIKAKEWAKGTREWVFNQTDAYVDKNVGAEKSSVFGVV